MKRLLVLLAAVSATVLVLLPGHASAHPLGNFTVNCYAGVEVAGSRVFVRYALDLAEIPAFQLGRDVHRPGFTARLAADLELVVDGRRAPLRVLEQRVRSRPGAGGLETLRVDVVYAAAGAGEEIEFVDRAFAGRIGWREVTVSARDGARVVRSTVPETSTSAALTAYPKSLLRSPLKVTRATALVEQGATSGSPPRIGAVLEGGARGAGGFEALVARGDLSVGAVLLSLLVAMFWGAAHALTPGHGKAMVAAYLVGTKGTPRHAFLLGGTVTLAHTAGVFAIGIVTLALSPFVVPERLYPWLTLVSGLLVVAVGAAVLRQRLRGRVHAGHGHDHDHPRGHPHDHRHHHGEHGHDHDHHRDDLTSKGILGVGVAAGLLPCPSALVVLLSAIALHRVGLGLALIVAFSVGLAATITAIGLVAVLARRAFGRLSLNGPLVRALPSVSAGLILAVGLLITARALPGVV